jgi:soluble P-type ATPase
LAAVGDVIVIDVPGFGTRRIRYIVCDFNGTLARDGRVVRGVTTRLRTLARHAVIHVVTADTFGTARTALSGVACDIHILERRRQSEAKRTHVNALGASNVAAIGNGRNDRGMLDVAALSIAVCGPEGLARAAFAAADVMVPSIVDALDLLIHPRRAIATLRD